MLAMRKPFVMVKMEGSKTTSKTGSLNALLLRAWRERWTDIQWGINIKTILPRGVSGDVYNLADCILQQATVGCGANQLVISYLKHSLAAQLVSYAAVLQRIAKFDALHKPHCVLSLLELLDTFLDHVTCQSQREEALIASAVSSTVLWLLQVFHYNLSKLASVGTNHIQSQEILEKSATLLNYIVHTDFLLAMFYLSKQEDQEEYGEITKKCQEINSLMIMNTQFKPPVAIHETLQVICNMDVDKIAPLNNNIEPITYCMQPLLAIDVLANPSVDTQVVVYKLLMVQRIKGYSLSRLYAELIRGSLLSLNNASGSATKQAVWGAFTFLKVPQIIHSLHNICGNNSSEEYSVEVIEAFEILLQSSPLLDTLDLKCSCNCVKALLESMSKLSLVTETRLNYFMQKRQHVDTQIQKLEPTGLQGSIYNFIVRAEGTLTGILKSMGTDFIKIQESIYAMLCQVVSGKNLEAILAVATVEGKLKHFVSKLIKFNEYSLQVTSDKGAQSKALLFDITFLLLCAIVQEYGAEAVLDENGDSFFEQWIRDCMIHKGFPKPPELILQKCDPQKVDLLIHHLINPEFDFKNTTMKSHDLCLNISGAMKEVLFLWEQGTLTANDVKRMLDALKQKMSSLAVCASAWLCSYVYVVHQDAQLKPMNMIQQFLTSTNDMEIPQVDNWKERSVLMMQIVRKMQYDIYPPTSPKKLLTYTSHSIVSKQPIAEQLDSVWTEVKKKGWIHIDATHTLENILRTAGPVWFVQNLIREVLVFRYQDDLDRAADLVFAMFHLNIERCTEALLLQVLPQYLYNAKLCEELVEPQASVLAKLTVYCIYSTLEISNFGKSNKKRTRQDDLDDDIGPNKLRRLNDNSSESMFSNNSQQSNTAIKEPLQSALDILFNVFNQLAAQNGEVTPQTNFIFKFLSYLVKCGRDRGHIVLQKLPTDLVPTLIKALPEMFDISILLRLHDSSLSYGRKDMARDLCLFRNMKLRPE